MKSSASNKALSPAQVEKLLQTLATRFQQNPSRHPGLKWPDVEARLTAHLAELRALFEMEATGGEPDVVSLDQSTGTYLFIDCSAETPKGRTSLCYDRAGWESRKEHRPKGNAQDLATTMGATLLTEEQYHTLQKLGPFDTKTSSWLQTPDELRRLGGALFCDHRYGRTFIYHNGAQSYYAARGFRCSLSI